MTPAKQALIIFAALNLSGCGLSGFGYSTPQQSKISRIDSEFSVVNFDGPFRYRPFTECTYIEYPDDTSYRAMVRMHLEPFGDRLRLTIDHEINGISTALLRADGTIEDFNYSPGSGRRLTPENTSAVDSSGDGSSLRFAPLEFLFPRLEQSNWTPGSTVSRILGFDGRPPTDFIYSGMGTFRGADSLLLNHVTSEARGQSRSVGFSLIDPVSMAPVVVVFGDPTRQLTLTSCE